ncbi:unnamed protein product [Symbiodinium sp. CCMP2456]|nr:unnamed protein product [Symbiodinium sp. CCMP2456]
MDTEATRPTKKARRDPNSFAAAENPRGTPAAGGELLSSPEKEERQRVRQAAAVYECSLRNDLRKLEFAMQHARTCQGALQTALKHDKMLYSHQEHRRLSSVKVRPPHGAHSNVNPEKSSISEFLLAATSSCTAFAFANMRLLLHTVAQQDSTLQMLLERNQGTALRAIWGQDECTAGNVLASEARQKVTFLYVSFQQYREALVSPRAWMAISCLAHEQVQRTKGGMAAITAVWLREWARQDLRTPFQVHGVDVCIELATFLADFEAMKASFAALGSSGIRPCFLCENVVMKGSPAPDRDPHFCSISEWDVTKFKSMKHEEVVGFMDDVFAKLPELNASALQLRERCSGFHILRESLWGCPTGRHLLKLDMVMNDNMHCYFAQGIASQELVLFTSAVCDATGFSVAQLGKAAADAGWLRPACYRKHGESKHWLARLFRESLWKGNMFKGSASQCESLVLLIRWYAVALQWNAVPALRKQYESFKQLALCADALKSTSRTKAWDSLATVQRDHMRCFLAAYPDGQERPKHHHRLHLPEQYKKQGFQCGCWATESKHRMYKGDLARQVQHFIQSKTGGVELSRQLLPKLLLRHCGLATENPLLLDGLWKLEQTVSAQRDCIASSFALGESVVAKQLRAGMLDVSRNDVLLHGPQWNMAVLCHFFCECANGSLRIGCTALELVWKDETQRVFKMSPQAILVAWQDLQLPRLPTWHRKDVEEFTCIL